ncbi:MAG TPA: sensor histidine kinase KdpD [Candidatus Dormibacteraeota bacterium]|nr:sensor histidine kinase KdpD [Candidatus Dormibacteraeota bacterium]
MEPPADLTPTNQPERRRGGLRVYLGAAPGSGKTYAMLREGRERRARGEDVAVALVETYNRPRTIEAIGDLEVIPRQKIEYRGTELEEMDLEVALVRHPRVALVDELAHSNAPGARNAKRWQDVEVLRDAGIDVISTLNVQHVESVKDVVERITGITVRETIPDAVLDGADEIQFVDIAPEALRKRMTHGNIYGRERVETALANFFRPGNLTALREIALRLVAQSMARSSGVVPSPEDVLIAVSCRETSAGLIRRGARMARRLGGQCVVLTVVPPGEPPRAQMATTEGLARQLGCAFEAVESDDTARAIIDAALRLGAEHVVLGEPARSERLFDRFTRSLVERVIDRLPDSDVHVIARVAVDESALA